MFPSNGAATLAQPGSAEVAEICQLTVAGAGDRPDFVTLVTPRAVAGYVRKADEICRLLKPGCAVLDWGCGSGLISFLLARRGLRVSAVDVALPPWVIAREVGVEPQIAQGRNAPLPFPDESFAGLVGCGVLEHVADQQERLSEVRRVLEPHGLLFVYNYPNAVSWVEWVFERLYRPTPLLDDEGNVHGHERKLRQRDLTALIEGAGFDVITTRVEDVLPLTMRALPARLRRKLLAPRRVWELVDRALLMAPLICQLGPNLTVIARRRG